MDVVTFGESMVLFQPLGDAPFGHAPLFVRSVAGAESNLCIALSRLGLSTRWVSRLGTDPFGDLIESTLRGEGVQVVAARDSSAPSAVFFREFGRGEPRAHYYRSGSAFSRISLEDYRSDWLEGARHLHVGGIAPALGTGPLEVQRALMLEARERGMTISFDPNLRRKLWSEARAREVLLELLPLCDVFLPSHEEIDFLFDEEKVTVGESFKAVSEQGVTLLVLKRGSSAAFACTHSRTLEVPTFAVERIIDPIGAGDAFAAGFLSRWLEESKPLETGLSEEVLLEALTRGCALGALATQFRGDWEGLPRRGELEDFLTGRETVRR